MSMFNDIVAGAVGGTIGGLAMFSIRFVGTQTGILKHSLPDKFERATAELTGIAERQDVEQQKELAIAEHLLLSAGLGVGYGLLHGLFKPPAILAGAIYGLITYAVLLSGLGPAMGVTEQPWERSKKSVGGEIFVHLVFGTVTASVVSRMRPRTGRPLRQRVFDR